MSHHFELCLLLLAAIGVACAESERTPAPEISRPETAWIEIAGEPFELELALDPQTHYRGLSGRQSIARNGGMLFVNSVPRSQAMVMRDCPIAIDVAFLDLGGRVVAIHSMQPEPPRRPDEAPVTGPRRCSHAYSMSKERISGRFTAGAFEKLAAFGRVASRRTTDCAMISHVRQHRTNRCIALAPRP